MLVRRSTGPRPSVYFVGIDMRYQLTPEIESQVLAFIRAGGFDWIAAEAAGIPRPIFEHWLSKGSRHGREPYRRFFVSVMQARAQARIATEVEARQKDPRFWLKHGPGRERPGYPGWSNPATGGMPPAEGSASVLDSVEVRALLNEMLTVLEEFPEARARMITALQKVKATQPPQLRPFRA